MDEFINRKTLLEDINETVLFTVREGTQLPTSEMRGANKVIDRIKSAPVADVVQISKTNLTDYEIISKWKKTLATGDAPIGEHWQCWISTKLAKDTFDVLNRQHSVIESLSEEISKVVAENEKLQSLVAKKQ